jgi:hypothetical protein
VLFLYEKLSDAHAALDAIGAVPDLDAGLATDAAASLAGDASADYGWLPDPAPVTAAVS